MQNKIKLVMDDEKILHDGIYDLNSIYSIIDDLLVNRKGLRKDGSFYIDDNPSDGAFAAYSLVVCPAFCF